MTLASKSYYITHLLPTLSWSQILNSVTFSLYYLYHFVNIPLTGFRALRSHKLSVQCPILAPECDRNLPIFATLNSWPAVNVFLLHRESHLFQNTFPQYSSLRFRGLNRADLNALIASNTFAFINLRILKAFFILNHWYSLFRTYRATGCTAATFLFSYEWNWNLSYFWHQYFPPIMTFWCV